MNERALGREMACPSCDQKIQLPSASQVESAKKAKQEYEQFDLRLRESLRRLSPKSRSMRSSDLSVSKATVDDLVERSEVEARLNDTLRWMLDNSLESRSEQAVTDTIEREEHELAEASISFARPKKKEEAEMDMTPMVDVTFLLLIFFLVTASFVVQKSIQRPAEKSDDPSFSVAINEEDTDAIKVQVDESNAYTVVISGVDTPAASKQDLIVLLANAFGTSGSGDRPTKLIVDAHENCIHAAVVGALDAGREAQFENFEVRTVEQFD